MVPKRPIGWPQVPVFRPWHFAASLLMYLVGSPFCLSIAESNLVVWERGDQIVQLARQDDASAPPNEHPVRVTADEIEAMLNELRLRYADDASDAAPVSVFTKEEIDNLGKAIAFGLERATPSQDIIFHVIGARRLSRGAFLRRNRVNAGRVFYRDGNLNIIFGQVQTPYRKKNVYGQIDEDFYPRNYGSRTAAAEHDVELLTNRSVRHYQGDAGTRDDWLVIEPGVASGGVADVTAIPEREGSGSSAVTVEPAPAQTAPTSAPAESTITAAGQVEESINEVLPPSTADIEERLEALKRLRERDLITEEAYQAKMKEILQDL